MAGNAPVQDILANDVWLWVIIFCFLVKRRSSLDLGFTDDSGSEQWAIEEHCHYPSLNVRVWDWQETQGAIYSRILNQN